MFLLVKVSYTNRALLLEPSDTAATLLDSHPTCDVGNFFIRVTCLIQMCVVPHPDVWRDSSIRVTWRFHMCDTTPSYVWHVSCKCVTWLCHMCDMILSHVWHDFFIRVTHASCICVTWLFHMCDMTLSHVWRDSFYMRDVAHSYVQTITSNEWYVQAIQDP